MKRLKNIDLGLLIKRFLAGYCVFLLVIFSVNIPRTTGEWDDYTLPIASILNDRNFTINESDILKYKEIFPSWEKNIDAYKLSGYVSKSGSGEMPWYFPTYAIVCIPFVLILQLLNLPTIFAFPYTNLFVLMISLIYLHKNLSACEMKKALLVFLLSVNPVIFYIGWTSAEVFIYSMLVMGAVCYCNKWDKRAAVFVSAAGMLNPTIMSLGLAMILVYFVRILKNNDNSTWRERLKGKAGAIIKYLLCYLIGVIPMAYNYYNTGHINLTAGQSWFTHGNESAFSRGIAYLVDLNYGFLPYYPMLLIAALILLTVAVVKRHVEYLAWMIAFLLLVFLYSINRHINCGMSGIARYNVWGAVVLIFPTVLYYDAVLKGKHIRKRLLTTLACGGLIAGIIIMSYNPYLAKNTFYLEMTPVAKWALEYCPDLYNPLFSTFNCRINHEDGAYDFEKNLPIVYHNEEGYIRKILASSENKQEILEKSIDLNVDEYWLSNQINKLGKEAGYISVPHKYKILWTEDNTKKR